MALPTDTATRFYLDLKRHGTVVNYSALKKAREPPKSKAAKDTDDETKEQPTATTAAEKLEAERKEDQHQQKKEKRKRRFIDEYDHDDPFLDDSEIKEISERIRAAEREFSDDLQLESEEDDDESFFYGLLGNKLLPQMNPIAEPPKKKRAKAKKSPEAVVEKPKKRVEKSTAKSKDSAKEIVNEKNESKELKELKESPVPAIVIPQKSVKSIVISHEDMNSTVEKLIEKIKGKSEQPSEKKTSDSKEKTKTKSEKEKEKEKKEGGKSSSTKESTPKVPSSSKMSASTKSTKKSGKPEKSDLLEKKKKASTNNITLPPLGTHYYPIPKNLWENFYFE